MTNRLQLSIKIITRTEANTHQHIDVIYTHTHIHTIIYGNSCICQTEANGN